MNKVVFVNRYYAPDRSATSQLLTDLASQLVLSGLEVHVVCSRQRYDDPRAHLSASEVVDGVQVHRTWTTRFGRDRLLGRALDYASFYFSSAWEMLRLLRRGDVIVAKTDPPLISIIAMGAAHLKGAVLINWLQDIFPEVASALGANPLPEPLTAMLRSARNASLRAARVNVVLGERMKDRLQRLGIGPGNICVIENWAELNPPGPKTSQDSRLRRELGLTDKFVVGYSGNLGRAHDYSTLFTAAAQLQSDPAIVFLMVGSGVGMAKLARRVTDQGLQNFRFLPYLPRDELADGLAAADVHWVSLLPSLEGLIVPSKFYGILAAGRPVLFIGDPAGELARVIDASGCGAAVPIGEGERVAALIAGWKRDRGGIERMGRRGYALYRDNYGAARAVDRWSGLLRPQDLRDGAAFQ